jgi:acetyltransferase-like isoleucine patch superfamily enzyme
VILDGATIGDGCVVGAGSVVSKALPPFSICFGAPASVRGTRR